jgi:hypothetical protein
LHFGRWATFHVLDVPSGNHFLVVYKVNFISFDFFRNAKDEAALRALAQGILSGFTVYHTGRPKNDNNVKARFFVQKLIPKKNVDISTSTYAIDFLFVYYYRQLPIE